MSGRTTTKSRIILGVWLIMLILLFFYRGYPAVTLILFFTLIYIILACVSVRISGRKLRWKLAGGDLVEKGEEVDIAIELSNDGKLPVFCCTCDVEAVNRLTGTSKHQHMRAGLPPGGSRTIKFTLSDECCGAVEVLVRSIDVWDPLMIFRREHKKGLENAVAYITPEIRRVQIPADWMDSYNMESYQYSQHDKGSDPGEVFGLREYRDGDSPRQIHWKLSAKLDEMTVKIPSFPIENNILVILDNLLEPGTLVEGEDRSGLVEDFCSLSMTLAEKNIPHSIGWYSVREDSFCIRRVRDGEELMGHVPEILMCGFDESELSTIYRYLEANEGNDFSNHFLVTAQEGRDSDRLESRGAVKIFRTGK